MRILVVTSLYFSGLGNWVTEQVRSLRSLNLEVDVIFFDTRRTRLHYGLRVPDVVRALRSKKYDIVHTHHTYTMLMVDIAKTVSRSRIPVVLTNHEPEIVDRQGRTRTWHPTSWLRHNLRLKRFAARRADYVIFVARPLTDVLAVDGRQAIIPCGVDLDKFKPMDRLACRRGLGIPQDRTVIFFPPAPAVLRKRFSLAKATHGIVRRVDPDCILVTGGGIPADEMIFYYNAADVVLQTSFCESSPTVVKEALACEIPVVSTNVGDTQEVLADVPYCAVCLEEPEALAKRVLEARGHRAIGGREQLLRKNLSLEQVAEQILRVYEEVLST